MVFWALLSALFLSTILMLQNINAQFMVAVPIKGGSVAIGVVGVPRFINPVLASSQADLDLVSLIYSGLMRKKPNGDLAPDLADKYEMSDSGLVYTFTLKENLRFQDGKPLAAKDVLFTIERIKDGIIASPRKANWDGVSAEMVDERTVKFTLKQPYASFLENTTLGILPAHLWANSPLELNSANTNPVGSGPYMVKSTKRQSSGIIDSYELVPFKKFILGEPYIENLSLHFYPNEDELIKALTDKKVEEASSISPANAENLKKRNYRVESAVLGRVFGLFFNQNANHLFTDKAVLGAIRDAIDKERIVRDVLSGYGESIEGPIPPNMPEYSAETAPKNTMPRADILLKAQNDLSKAGWKKNADGWLEKTTTQNKKKTTVPLEFSISTGNTPELAKTALLIKEDLESLGMKVEIKTFDVGSLNQSVIRPRAYDALLFGQIINHQSDLFAFWHSSQRNDPGLNVSMYTNVKVDKILEEASAILDKEARMKKYDEFEKEIAKDTPAVFLFSPDFIYIVSKKTRNFKMDRISSPEDRYGNAHLWYTDTENVWKIFY